MRSLTGVIVLAAAVRLVLIALTPGHPYDMHSIELVGEALRHDPLRFYALNPAGETAIWPYLPGYAPLAALTTGLADLLGIAGNHLERIPQAAADLGIAWLAGREVERRAGASAGVAAAAVVALGPALLLVSSVHGQIDSVAFLPATAAAIAFNRDPERFALRAGVLMGIAVTVKHPAGIVLLALLATVRSPAQAARLLLPAAAIPVAVTLPFLLTSTEGFGRVLEYAGVSGYGGLEMVVHRGLAVSRMVGGVPFRSGAAEWLHDHATLITVVAVLGATAVCRWRRLPVYDACALIVLVTLASLAKFGPWYAVWPIAFLVLGGRARLALLFQAVLLVPMLLLYRDLLLAALPGDPTLELTEWAAINVYAPLMILVVLVCAGLAVAVSRRAASAPAGT